MEKINIAEILRDCPSGMELYSPLCGKCVFDRLSFGTIICKKQNTQEITFTSEGYYMLPVFDNCECVIFPSKDQRDWSKFQRPFKDGDVLSNGICICIYNGNESENYYGLYIGVGHIDYPNYFIINTQNSYFTKENAHLATEEEKQKLFDAIKENGYKWNSETKTLEKLITLKFKIGDKIRAKGTNSYTQILGIKRDQTETYYETLFCEISVKDQDKFELVPSKFDITTLKPFDKVLVRESDEDFWSITMYSHFAADKHYPFVTIFVSYPQCIPYEGNQHLLGTTDECDEYYKTWK